MGEGSDYPIYDGWYDIAKPVNLFIAYALMGLSVVFIVVYAIACVGGFGCVIWVGGMIRGVMGIVAGVLYLIFCMKPVKEKDLNKTMHILLIVCEVLCWVCWWPIAILMTLQFVMVGILSDVPFWEAFKSS